MEVNILKKDCFTIMGEARTFSDETCKKEIPVFWDEYLTSGKEQQVTGVFGVVTEENMSPGKIEYVIGDLYNPIFDIPKGFVTRTIPALTWAVFPCHGPIPQAIQKLNMEIFSEWVVKQTEYTLDKYYLIEVYDDPTKYPLLAQDENYYSEIWISVKEK